MQYRFLKCCVLLREYRMPLLITSCSGVFAAKMFYHVFPDSSYRQLYECWNRGEPVVLSEKLQTIFQQVLMDVGASSTRNFSAFASFGFFPVSAGIPWLPGGAKIGIPAIFDITGDDPGGSTYRQMVICYKNMELDSDLAAALKESLVLSSEAQKFAIAREVAYLQSGGPFLKAALAPVCLSGVWVSSVVLKVIFSLRFGPLLFRGLVNVIALGLGAASYNLMSGALSQWLDYASDRRAAGVSHEYVKGGVEFYNKILSRNKTLRARMGKKGETFFAPNGNLFPAHLLQIQHAPYTFRREGILKMQNKEKV